MSNMSSSLQEGGYINKLLLSLIGVSVLFVGVTGFGVWAFLGRQDYKNNSDQKVAAAVQETVEQTQAEEAERYAEESKEPLKPYTGPSQYGSIRVEYPKTWSAYVINRDQGNQPVEWYMHPNVVPDISDRDNAYALRIELVSQSYDRELRRFDGAVRNDTVRVRPYTLPNVEDIVGSRIDGEVVRGKQGRMIMLPLRDQTLKIWSESTDFLPDFEKHILPNLSFSP
jgi:hypothetical protein